jgi:Fic family protein
MKSLYEAPMININMVADKLGLKHNTATALVNDFVKLGVLLEVKQRKRNRLFWFKDYIMIFSSR